MVTPAGLALHVSREASGSCVRDPRHYTLTISTFGRRRQWQRALTLLSDMIETNVHADVICFSAGISACSKGGQWQQALLLLRKMGEVKVEPDSATALGSARARKAGGGNRPCGYFARCGRRSWSQTLQLQRCDQCVRQMRAVAASPVAVQ
ncbi:unnamed protein product [Prorocentrum cordatum]|uniref:Uncharacterized protein n=1 Tax=Prorocentrum cordatum TaxID=2364126 RepID=A0ABN9TZB0_9DINO|nr:unnamed protein product [Polarella glacialis]